jgi:hypothetical protein
MCRGGVKVSILAQKLMPGLANAPAICAVKVEIRDGTWTHTEVFTVIDSDLESTRSILEPSVRRILATMGKPDEFDWAE